MNRLLKEILFIDELVGQGCERAAYSFNDKFLSSLLKKTKVIKWILREMFGIVCLININSFFLIQYGLGE